MANAWIAWVCNIWFDDTQIETNSVGECLMNRWKTNKLLIILSISKDHKNMKAKLKWTRDSSHSPLILPKFVFGMFSCPEYLPPAWHFQLLNYFNTRQIARTRFLRCKKTFWTRKHYNLEQLKILTWHWNCLSLPLRGRGKSFLKS